MTVMSTSKKAMIDTVTLVIVVIFLLAGLMLIYYQIDSSVDTKQQVLSITSRFNTKVVIPDTVLNAPCISIERGLISLQGFKNNYCGLNCLDLRKSVQIELKSPIYNQKCPPTFTGPWTYERSFPVTLVNETSGERYEAQLLVRS